MQLYEYPLGLLHAKTLTVDGNIALVGSANMIDDPLNRPDRAWSTTTASAADARQASTTPSTARSPSLTPTRSTSKESRLPP